jgi:hypothetical protein
MEDGTQQEREAGLQKESPGRRRRAMETHFPVVLTQYIFLLTSRRTLSHLFLRRNPPRLLLCW